MTTSLRSEAYKIIKIKQQTDRQCLHIDYWNMSIKSKFFEVLRQEKVVKRNT